MKHTVVSSDWIQFEGELDENSVETYLGTRDNPIVRVVKSRTGNHTVQFPEKKFVTVVLHKAGDGEAYADYSGDKFTTSIVPGNVTICPPSIAQRYDVKGWMDNSIMLIDTSIFERIAELDPNLPSIDCIEPLPNVCRPRLARLIAEQQRTFATHEAGWRVLAETNNMRMALEILMTFKSGRPGYSVMNTLSEDELSALNEFIRENLTVNFSLSDLSSVLDRSPLQMARAFKSTTGETPYRYVLMRRVERARTLLKSSEKTIAEIAYECGFASQSHMTTVFSGKLGITPAKYRKVETE